MEQRSLERLLSTLSYEQLRQQPSAAEGQHAAVAGELAARRVASAEEFRQRENLVPALAADYSAFLRGVELC